MPSDTLTQGTAEILLRIDVSAKTSFAAVGFVGLWLQMHCGRTAECADTIA